MAHHHPRQDLNPSPFTLACRLRAYAEALRRNDPLAQEIQDELGTNAAAALYPHRIASGIPRCQRRPSLRACANNGQFAVTSDHSPDLLKIACRQHLQDMAPTRCELVASLGEELPRYAVNLQELQRIIRHNPKLADTYEFELQDIRRRLRPNNFHTNTDYPYHPARQP